MELQEKKKNRTEQKTDMQNKEKALLTQLDEIAKQDLCLAFSGGVDSSLLLKLVMDASAKYGTKVYAVTFQTRLHPPCDLETATRVAKEVGAVHEVLFVDELEQEEINYDVLDRIADGEAWLHTLFGAEENLRLRVHGDVVRLEIAPERMGEVLEKREEMIAYLKKIGFSYLTMDLEGFRSGSMDEKITQKEETK